jgi:hypothetical protein
MNVSKVVRRRIRHSQAGIDVVADINAAVASTVNGPGRRTVVSTRQTVVQRDGVTRTTTTTKEDRDAGSQA